MGISHVADVVEVEKRDILQIRSGLRTHFFYIPSSSYVVGVQHHHRGQIVSTYGGVWKNVSGRMPIVEFASITISILTKNPYRWVSAPPITREYFSINRKPGVVRRVPAKMPRQLSFRRNVAVSGTSPLFNLNSPNSQPVKPYINTIE